MLIQAVDGFIDFRVFQLFSVSEFPMSEIWHYAT